MGLSLLATCSSSLDFRGCDSFTLLRSVWGLFGVVEVCPSARLAL